MYDVRWTIAEFARVARENLLRETMLGSRFCSIINGLNFLLAYLLHPWETHEEWVE